MNNLIEKEQLFNQLFTSPHIGILLVDKYRKNILINSKICNMFGYEQNELIGKSAEIFHISKDSYKEFAIKAFNIVLAGKPVSIDYKFRRKDGTIFWAHIAGDLVKNRENVLWTFVDITKNIEANQELKIKKSELLAINSLVNLGVWNLDFTTKKAKISSEFCNILKFKKGTELTYKEYLNIVHKDDRKTLDDSLKILLDGGSTKGTQVRLLIDNNGKKEIRHVFQKATIVYDKNGKPKSSIGAIIDITKQKNIELELKEQKELFKQLAYHDDLTGLPNRALLLDRLEQSIKIAKRKEEKLAVLFIDLDDFKSINDALGHDKGDFYLRELSINMQSRIRESDVLARLGGDEFVVILNGINNQQDIITIIENGMTIVDDAIKIDEEIIYPRMSVGVAIYPTDGKDCQALLKNADAAMYKAKANGRHTYSFYDKTMTQKAYERMNMEKSLRNAMINDELLVYFQPQINANKKKVIGMEALVRWQNPTKGFLNPVDFLPIAEEIGMMKELNRHVMDKAIEQFSKWKKDGLDIGTLSLNMATKQLECPDCFKNLKAILDKHKFKANWLELEVTEGELINKPEMAVTFLQQIRDLGVKISIDDFGTGYSSMAYLKNLPINKLKIDKSFIDNLVDNKKDRAITKTIIELAHNLNLEVIAEGVEQKEQKDMLLKNGCANIQGYYYSKPIPADEMEVFFNKYKGKN
jgi:diguanylate cyclase (GGDEF)-like protein/PAS domain S-box-containing protein